MAEQRVLPRRRGDKCGLPDRDRLLHGNGPSSFFPGQGTRGIARLAPYWDAFDGGDAGGPQSKGPKLSDAEHMLRASIYQFNRDFDGARLHYLAVIDKDPRSGTVPNALYQIGRGFYLQQRYEEALKYFQRVVDQFPEQADDDG